MHRAPFIWHWIERAKGITEEALTADFADVADRGPEGSCVGACVRACRLRSQLLRARPSAGLSSFLSSDDNLSCHLLSLDESCPKVDKPCPEVKKVNII
jgi:hypothetical protein